jgi:hypothetical protein
VTGISISSAGEMLRRESRAMIASKIVRKHGLA